VIAVQHSKQFNRPTPKLLSKDEARGIASNNIAKAAGAGAERLKQPDQNFVTRWGTNMRSCLLP
jgi:hypothetical protein